MLYDHKSAESNCPTAGTILKILLAEQAIMRGKKMHIINMVNIPKEYLEH